MQSKQQLLHLLPLLLSIASHNTIWNTHTHCRISNITKQAITQQPQIHHSMTLKSSHWSSKKNLTSIVSSHLKKTTDNYQERRVGVLWSITSTANTHSHWDRWWHSAWHPTITIILQFAVIVVAAAAVGAHIMICS